MERDCLADNGGAPIDPETANIWACFTQKRKLGCFSHPSFGAGENWFLSFSFNFFPFYLIFKTHGPNRCGCVLCGHLTPGSIHFKYLFRLSTCLAVDCRDGNCVSLYISGGPCGVFLDAHHFY